MSRWIDSSPARSAGGLHVAWAKVGDPLPIGLAGNWTGDTATAVCDVECSVTAPEDLRLDMPALGFDDLAWYVSTRTQASGNDPCHDGADRTVIPHRWYEIATNGWPTSGQDPTLAQWGDIEGPSGPVPVHVFMPALSVNEAGDVGLIMARASSMENLSIQATGRFADDPDGTMFALTTIKGSNSPEVPDSNRWGDYFTAVPDPSGDGTFWGFAMYMIDNVADPDNPTPLNPDDDGFGTWIFILLGP